MNELIWLRFAAAARDEISLWRSGIARRRAILTCQGDGQGQRRLWTGGGEARSPPEEYASVSVKGIVVARRNLEIGHCAQMRHLDLHAVQSNRTRDMHAAVGRR